VGHDTLVVDTAGRLHVDAELMAELVAVHAALQPQETLFVADAMTGQDAVKSAGEFAAALPLSGVVLTKLDGDSRGGARRRSARRQGPDPLRRRRRESGGPRAVLAAAAGVAHPGHGRRAVADRARRYRIDKEERSARAHRPAQFTRTCAISCR
jgi:hypothetical protein